MLAARDRLAPSTAPLADLHSSEEIRILVVDDDPAACAVAKAALADRNFRIEAVSDPDRVERVLGRGNYHLLILDYVLPGLDADRVFGWVRDHQPDAAVIVVTGYPSVDSVTTCLRARTYDYLTKPFAVDKLRETVVRCLESRGLLRMTEKALQHAIGAAIRDRRKTMGLTLATVSERTEVSLGYLSQIELGKNSASIETLYRVCLALGLKMSDLFAAIQRG